MKNKWLFIIPLAFTVCCIACIDTSKELDLGPFKITVPLNWKFQDPGDQEDSFVGYITGPKVTLSFDCSERGYANHLMDTEDEYLHNNDWWDGKLTFPYWGTKKTIHFPNTLQKIKFPKADYVVDLTYKGDTIYLPIEIPAVIKAHHIQVDSNSINVFKTIWPKVAGKGMTGIYIYSRTSSFNFQMNGENLSTSDQQLALKAFKTITFKR